MSEELKKAIEQDYIEEEVEIECAGLKMTLFVQRFPHLHAQTPDEVTMQVQMMNIHLAMQNLRRFGKVA
jgi:hypothetical protein